MEVSELKQSLARVEEELGRVNKQLEEARYVENICLEVGTNE